MTRSAPAGRLPAAHLFCCSSPVFKRALSGSRGDRLGENPRMRCPARTATYRWWACCLLDLVHLHAIIRVLDQDEKRRPYYGPPLYYGHPLRTIGSVVRSIS